MSINAPAAPGPLPDGPPQPAAGPGAARAHVRRLRQDGSTYPAIATTAGLAPATVSGLAAGRRRPTRGTTAAVLAVTSGTVPRGRVDAGGTRLRLRALHVMGHGSARIARALGVRETAIRQLVRGDARTIRPEAARRRRRPVRRLVGQARPRPHPRRTRRRHRRPQQAPSPGTGAPPPPWTTTSSTPPATGPARAGNPPPAPASPPTSARPPAAAGGGPPMTSDHRVTPGLIADILDALERHGHDRGDDLHADRAIGLIGDLARIYEGTQDHPATAYPRTTPPSPPAYPGPSRHDAVTLTRADTSTVFAALDIAADDKRYRAEMCPDCPGPVLPHLPDPPPRRPGLRPDGRPHAPGRPSRPRCQRQPARARSRGPSPPPTGRPASDALPPETGQTSHRPAAHAPDPWPPGGRAGHAGNRRTLRPAVPRTTGRHRPEYVIVVDQLRDWQPGQPPSLAELLEAGPARTREPEPDLEAEP